VNLLEDNDFNSLVGISKNDRDVCCFETKIEKENTEFSELNNRSISIKQKIFLNQKDTSYFLKGEVYKNGSLVSINFLYTEVLLSDPHEFHRFFINYDFLSFLNNI
jgi:hypothetical protein